MTDRPTASTINDAQLDQLFAELAGARARIATLEHVAAKPVGTHADWPTRRAGLRDDIARAIHRYDRDHLLSRSDIPSKHHRGEADAVLALLYREWPWLRAEAEESFRPLPTACGHGPELDRLTAELADYDERAEQQKQRADEAEQRLRNIAHGGPRADAVQAEIGEMIRQTHELRDQLRRAETELQQHAENESADAAAGSYALRAERVEAQLARVTALYEQWVQAGPPPLGVPTARWWDRRLVEFQDAIRPAAEQPRATPNNPPGSTREQLPDAVLALLPDKPYLSTACDTAQQLDEVPLRVGGTSSRRSGVNIAWLAGPMHGRCRLNHKFTGALCICPCHQHAGA